MKKLFIILCVTLILSFIMPTLGCKKSENNQIATTALLNPENASYDESVDRTYATFKEKGFKLLSENYWLDSDKPKYMAIFSKPGSGSHASSAEIGGIYAEYTESTKKWDIKAESLSFKTSGSWGEAPVPRFIKIGKDRYGFMMVTSFTGQGYTNSVTTIYGVVGTNFVEMISVPTGEDNSGTGNEAYEVRVNLKQELDKNKEAYDITAILNIDGKHTILPEDEYGKVFGNSQEITFIFKDGVYVKSNQGK